jgi:hypothetical protein
MGQEGQDLYQQWRTNPMSQFLWNLGQHMMAHGDKPIGEALTSAMPHAMSSLQEVMEYQHKLAQKQAEEKAHMDYSRRMSGEGYASGGIVRHKYATDGAVMDEGGDFFGDLGSLFGGDEQQAAPRQQATAQPQQGGDFFGDLFGGFDQPEAQSARAQPMAYAPQQEPVGGFFDDLFGGAPEQAQPAQRAPAGRQVAQSEPQGNILDDIFGGIFGGGAEAASARTPSIAPRTEPKAAGKPTEPAKVEEPAKTPEGAPKPTETAPVTGGKPEGAGAPTTVPGTTPGTPEQPRPPASIYEDPRVKELDRQISHAWREQPKDSFERGLQTNYIAQKERMRQQVINQLKDERDYQEKQRLAEEKKIEAEKLQKQKQADAANKVHSQQEERQSTQSAAAATKKLAEDADSKDAAEAGMKIAQDYANALTVIQSSGLKEQELKALGLMSIDQVRAISPQLAKEKAAYDIITKSGPEAVKSYTQGYKGAVRVAEIKLGEKALPSLDKSPEANKKILANWMGGSQRNLDRFDAMQSKFEKNATPLLPEYNSWRREFETQKGHKIEDYTKHFYERLGIAGAPPEIIEAETAKELGISPKGEKSRAEGAPQYSIQPGHAEGDWVYKGGDPNDKSNWEHK